MSNQDYHEEEVLGKAYDARLMRRLMGFFKPYKTRVVLSIGLVLAAAGVALIGPYLTKIAIDDFITKGDFAGLTIVAATRQAPSAAAANVAFFPIGFPLFTQ